LEPTTYYGRQSGIGQVLLSANEGKPLRLCGVGLGCGVLASYGREGDCYDFIEINPAVTQVALKHFTFIGDSKARVVNHLGDGRLVLERMSDRQFDVIALDAFSSDAIPAHLLTREAMSLYQSRLAADGIIAIHVSNKHLDLAPLVHRLSREAGLLSKLVHSEGDLANRTLPALWVVVADASNSIWSNERMKLAAEPDETTLAIAPLWTDQNHNLISVFRVR
jgi:spermidine synthase